MSHGKFPFRNRSLNELQVSYNLSRRATNVCRGNGILSLYELMEWWRLHLNFMQLKKCGNKTADELTKIASDHIINVLDNFIPGKNSQTVIPNNIISQEANILKAGK
jgi:hypothetical protein